MSSLHDYFRRSTREVKIQNGRKITVGTQTLDKCWDYCKAFIQNSVHCVHTKNAKNKLLNAEIWNYVGVSENSVPLNPMVNDHYPY